VNSNHASFDIQSIPRELPESSIRLRSLLINLTSNHLIYARMDAFPYFYWWDEYPVSNSYPVPDNHPSAWAIIQSLLEATHRYLKLKPGEPIGHRIETSRHCQRIFDALVQPVHSNTDTKSNQRPDNHDSISVRPTRTRPQGLDSPLHQRYSRLHPNNNPPFIHEDRHPSSPGLSRTATSATVVINLARVDQNSPWILVLPST
ncbi:uncharacterized protein N7511_003764, partial [Penicillium nucicola]|uniref:uncharacterized protein n=1 Tax=Penicillium nucicola TaxID=1850975 RepID=UPI002545AB7D